MIIKNLKLIPTLIIIFLAIYLLNYYTSECSDDFTYKFSFDPKLREYRVQTVSDIISSQYYHYLYNNGRSWVQSLEQFFVGILGKSSFNFFNSFVYIFFCILLSFISGKINTRNLLFYFSLIFFCYPAFAQTMLWMSGSFNYLWVSVIITLIIIFIPKFEKIELSKPDWLLLLPGIFAGWSHEGFSFPLSCSFIIFLFVNRKHILHSAAFPLILGFIIGSIICTLSPGTFLRIEPKEFIPNFTILSRLKVGWNLFLHLKLFFILVAVIIVKLFVVGKNALNCLVNFYKNYIILCNAIIFSFPILFLCGKPFLRVLSNIEFFSLLLIASMLKNHHERFLRDIKSAIILTLIPIYSLTLFFTISNYKEYKNIEDQLMNGSSELILYNEIYIPRKLASHILVFTTKNELFHKHWINRWVAQTYSREKLIFMPKSLYELIIKKEIDICNQFYNYHGVYIRSLEDKEFSKTPFAFYVSRNTLNNIIDFNNFNEYEFSMPVPDNRYEILNIDGNLIFISNIDNYKEFKPIGIELQ